MSKLSASHSGSLLPLDLWSRLDQATAQLPARWAGWLSTREMLTDRISREAGERSTVHLLEEHIGFLSAEQQALLAAPADSSFLRRIEVRAGGRPWLYAETLIPDHVLEAHPWLAELSDRALPEVLAWRDDVAHGPIEVATLLAAHPLAARALERVGRRDEAVWARRSWVAIGGLRLLIQEAFLPEPKRR